MVRIQRRSGVAISALVAALFSAAAARAQVVQGTVRGGGAPLVGATVRLLELDRMERTDAQGAFRFTDVPNGTYRVYAGVLGYLAATDTVRATGGVVSASFDLTPSAIPLKEIVVSGSPAARPADEQYQSVESKSEVEFDNSPGMSFAEKMTDLPGVTARWNGSAPSRPIFRGLGDNEVLVLENGLRMGDIATFDPAHATPIDALSIAQIDVVRGPATILYGPNTIGGLVNVITNLVPIASDRPLSGTAVVEGNSVSNEYAGYINNVYTLGKSAFRVSAGGLHSADIGIPTGTYTVPGTDFGFRLNQIPQSGDRTGEGGVGYSYQSGFGMVGIGVNHFETNYGVPGVPPNAGLAGRSADYVAHLAAAQHRGAPHAGERRQRDGWIASSSPAVTTITHTRSSRRCRTRPACPTRRPTTSSSRNSTACSNSSRRPWAN